MKNRLNNEEKFFLIKFDSMKIPTIFKIDKTDRILFIENIIFTIRSIVLKNRIIPKDLYNQIFTGYERFIENTQINDFDEYALQYFIMLKGILEILKKCY